MRLDQISASHPRLAIVVSHPIQYYAPWFAHLAEHLPARLRVFYLWDFGLTRQLDRGFGRAISWEIDLLEGYEHRFVSNRAGDPGTHHFNGLRNPGLVDALLDWGPDAILLFGYRYWSHLQVITSRRLLHLPLLFRGDSHLLAERRAPFSRMVKRLSLRLLFRRFAAFLPVGRANAAYFRRHGVAEEKLFPAPHAVDQRRFAAEPERRQNEARAWRRELGIPEQHRVILFAGKFERKKRPDDLVRAFLAADLRDATLLLVGDGALEPELRRLAAGSRTIRLAPFQNQAAMPRTYAAADLVVLPSCGAEETWGMVVNEALGCGKPVVVSTHVGCQSDLVEAGRNGLVFPAGNGGALSAALREAFAEPARLEAWGAEGRKIISRFSYRETTAGLQRALDAVLPRKGGR